MTLHEEIQELTAVRDMKQNKLFQKYFVEPIYKELDTLGKSYECESLRELATLKGKAQGHKFFIKLMKQIDEDYTAKMIELKSDEA